MPILCHKTSRPVSSKIIGTPKCKKDNTKADWNASVRSKIDCRRTPSTGVSATKVNAVSKSGELSRRVNSIARSNKQGKDEEGVTRANGTASTCVEKDRPIRKPVGKTLISRTRANKTTNDVKRVRDKLDTCKKFTRNGSGKVNVDKSDATRTKDLPVGTVNSMDGGRSRQQDKELTVKSGTEEMNDKKESSIHEERIRDELSTTTKENSGYNLSLCSFDDVDGHQTVSITKENITNRDTKGIGEEQLETASSKPDQSSVQDALRINEANLNFKDASDANSAPKVNVLAGNIGSTELLHEGQMSDRRNFEHTENENGAFGPLIGQFAEKSIITDEINDTMSNMGAIKEKIVSDESNMNCENKSQMAGDSILCNENSEFMKQSLITSITSGNKHEIDIKLKDNQHAENLKPTTTDDGSFPNKDSIVSTRTPFFCSLFDDPITNKIRSSYVSLDYVNSSEMPRKGRKTENGIKRSESLNDNILSPSHKKSGFFHHLKELTVDSESSTILSIATKAENRSADDIQVANESEFSLDSNRSQFDIKSTQCSSSCHDDEGILVSNSNMLNVTLDRDMDHELSLLIGKELEINHETKNDLPASLAEIGRESAISRTFTLEEENVDSVTVDAGKCVSISMISLIMTLPKFDRH